MSRGNLHNIKENEENLEKMGRTTKLLKPLVRETILKLIADGNYIKTACMAAGIDYSSYNNWQRWSEDYRNNPDGNANKKIYFNLFEQLKKAEAKNIAANVKNIQECSKKNNQWAASAWLLERKYPAEFGKRMELELGPSPVLIKLQEMAMQARLKGSNEADINQGACQTR